MRILVIFLAGATCLAGIYLSLNRRPGEGGLESNPRPFLFSPAQVTGLSLSGPEKDLSLVFKDGEWWLDRPQKALADGAEVEEILTTLAGIKPVGAVKGAKEAEFGFDRPHLELDLTLEKGPLEFQVGYAAGPQGGRYLRRKGSRTAFLVTGEEIARLDKDLLTLRDKRITSPDLVPILEMAVDGPGLSWVLDRTPGGWELTGGGARGKGDSLLVEEILAALQEDRIEAFLDHSPADALALTIRLRAEKGRGWIRLWPPQNGAGTAVGRSGRHQDPFLVPGALYQALARTGSDLLDRRLMPYDPRLAGRLEVVRLDVVPPLRLVVERSPRGIWRVVEPDQDRPEGPKVDQARAAALVDSLAQVRYLERSSRDLDRVTVRVSVFDPGGRVLAGLELGRGGSGELLGRKLNEGQVYRVGEELQRLLPGPWTLDKAD